jgi:hypothetical protein
MTVAFGSGMVAAGLVFLAGCGCEPGVTGDAFPIAVDMASGPVIATISEGGDERRAVLDLLAPLTALGAPAGTPHARRCADLTLRDTGGIPRAHLDLTVTTWHFCEGDVCEVGDDAARTEIDAVIGGDGFAPGAVRFDFAAQELTLFPDIAGDAAARGRLCEASFPDPFRGGGTLAIGGTEVSFPARRITMGACLSYDPEEDADLVTVRGADVQLVVSTGIGPTILSESAYMRWLDASGTGTPLGSLPAATVWMADGPIPGRAGTIDRLALVGGYDDQRGPCRQVWAHHLLSQRNCQPGEDCPCSDAQICRVPAIAELAPAAPIPVLVVPDDHDLLQALRTELRPRTAEVDGVLGTGALAATSLAVDAPNDRILIRCEAAGCRVRPELITTASRGTIDDCLDRQDALAGVDAGVDAGLDAAPPDAVP